MSRESVSMHRHAALHDPTESCHKAVWAIRAACRGCAGALPRSLDMTRYVLPETWYPAISDGDLYESTMTGFVRAVSKPWGVSSGVDRADLLLGGWSWFK
jgi:hypothetical protein